MTVQTKAAFDLDALQQDDTAVIEIVHPSTGDPIGASVTVYGQDSKLFIAETRKVENKITEYGRRNRGKLMPAEDRAALDRQKVINCTKSIDGLLKGGQPFADPETVFDAYPWIYEQTVQGIMDRSNFIKGSSSK